MNILSIKVLGALAVAGLFAAGGSAFTAAGMSAGAETQPAFIGGTVSQSISTGAELDTVAYHATGNGSVDTITFTFVANAANADREVTLVATGETGSFSCTNVGDNTLGEEGVALPNVSVCTNDAPTTGLSGIAVTVHGDETP
jgi:hypothetical protein